MCLNILIREILIKRKEGKLGSNRTVKFSKGKWHHIKKSGQEGVHREASFKSVILTSAIRALPDLRKGHKTKPCPKKDAPAESHGNLAKHVYKPENTDNATFYSPIEARAMPAPTAKISQGRRIRG